MGYGCRVSLSKAITKYDKVGVGVPAVIRPSLNVTIAGLGPPSARGCPCPAHSAGICDDKRDHNTVLINRFRSVGRHAVDSSRHLGTSPTCAAAAAVAVAEDDDLIMDAFVEIAARVK